MGKRLNGEGSITYDSTKKLYRVRISVDGKRIGSYHKEEKDAVQELTELRRKYGFIKFDNNMTLAEWYLEWLFNIKFHEVSARTVQRYHGVFKNHIEPLNLSKMRISEIGKYDISKAFNTLVTKGSTRQQIEEVKTCLSISFNAAGEFIEKNPCRNVPVPKNAKDNARTYKNKSSKGVSDEGEYNAFTQSEQKKLMGYLQAPQNTFKGTVIHSAIIFALGTGLRAGELMALDYTRDFNEDYTKIKVTQNVQHMPEYNNITRKVTGYKRALTDLKTINSYRDIIMPETLTAFTKKYIMELKKHSLKDEYFTNNNLLFPNELGDYLDKKILRRWLERITEKLKISKVNFHGLRHTYATRLLENGVSMDVISKLLGHSSIDITQNVYAHVLEDKKQKEIELAGDFIGLK